MPVPGAPGWRQRIRGWLKPPRRLRVLRSGGFLIFGTFALGLATLNTGNNLLYLLMGALLGTIVLSGWLSEQALRDVHVRRVVPRAVTAGETARLEYAVENRKRRLPSHGLEIAEIGLERADESGPVDEPGSADAPDASGAPGAPGALGAPGARRPRAAPAFVAALEPGTAARIRTALETPMRGVYPLQGVVLGTSFPFGLFAKERDLTLPGVLTVWPRTDRRVRLPRLGGRRGQRQEAAAGALPGGARGEYRGLREYRPGDDPRDIHWRTSARRGEPIVRQYDRDAADEYWVVLDTVAPDAAAGEACVEIAASVLDAATRRGDRCGLAVGAARVPPSAGPGGMEAALDVLAGAVLASDGGPPALPAPAGSCVLVTARTAAAVGWGDVYRPGEEGPA